MNKHYDGYLLREPLRPYIEVINPDGTRKKIYLGINCIFNNCTVGKDDLTPTEQYEQGQMECIKLGFKFYGWVFSIIFAIGILLLGAYYIK